MTTYYSDSSIVIRSMKKEDAKIFYDTYVTYGWHPSIDKNIVKGLSWSRKEVTAIWN